MWFKAYLECTMNVVKVNWKTVSLILFFWMSLVMVLCKYYMLKRSGTLEFAMDHFHTYIHSQKKTKQAE